MALPGARFFVLYEDWMECLYGRRFGGYLGSEFASVVWLEKLLKQEGCPRLDVAVLDEIAERRTSKAPPTRMQVVLVALGAFAAVIFLFWLAIATGSNVVAAVAPMILTPLMLGLFAMWRIKLKGVPNLSATRLLSCRVVVRDLRLGGGPDMQARRKVICGAREFFW